MIDGYGNIASILNDRDGALFFARGVSDSSCTDIFQFRRETIHLRKHYGSGLCCFYFSSIGIAYNSSPYFKHKLEMEEEVKRNFDNHYIIRIGNIDWDKNPKTFLNFMREKIAKGEHVEIRDEYRYMVSQEQLLMLTDNLPLVGRGTINIFGRMAKVKDLL